jgi:formylglycine-generating enzyme
MSSGGTSAGTAGSASVGGAGVGGRDEEGGAAGAGGDDCSGGQGGCADDDGPPSCVGLANGCGPTATDTCCASSLIPGSLGPFSRGNDPQYPATVGDFRLDKYEVTVGRFRKFATAYLAGWRPSDGSGKNVNDTFDVGWLGADWNPRLPAVTLEEDKTGLLCDPTFQTWTPEEGSAEDENRPLNCVSWFLAHAFCIWDGGRLPSEAEWNYAAAGGSDALGWRQFPWSDPSSSTVIDETYASYYSTDCLGDGETGCTRTDLIVVGSKPAGNGRWGQADLGGNVGEWIYDLYGEYPLPCTNCSNQVDGADRAFRGGSYDNDASYLLSSTRRGRNPAHTAANVGVRCARNAR